MADYSAMDIVDIPDKGGNSLRLQRVAGRYHLLCFNPANLLGVKTCKLRNDDIYLCAYPRTGTHWVFERICMLLNGNAETIRKYKGTHQLEESSENRLDDLPSPRALNTHMCLSDGPEQLVEKKCRIVYNLRNPKDVAVSLYKMYCKAPFCQYKGSFKDFLELFLDGKVEVNGIFGHFLDAERFIDEHPEHPVHFEIYEETIKDPFTAVQKLSDFLGLERNNNLCQDIAEKFEFSRMVVDKHPYDPKYEGKLAMYRKGGVGDWRNWFTDEMLKDYYRVYEEKMAGSRFYQQYAE